MKKPSLHLYSKGTGVTLRCRENIAAFTPDGKEIISRYWGKRNHGVSQHKLLVLELVNTGRNNGECSREDLIKILELELRKKTTIRWNKTKLDERLSTLLAQLKSSFAPYKLFEKTETGYRLDPSVKIEFITPQILPMLSQNSFEEHFAFSF